MRTKKLVNNIRLNEETGRVLAGGLRRMGKKYNPFIPFDHYMKQCAKEENRTIEEFIEYHDISLSAYQSACKSKTIHLAQVMDIVTRVGKPIILI